MLLLKNIVKSYGSTTVLKFDQWKINPGIYWLKGGNGTGKTTLFRIISGQTPFEGEVELDSISLKQDPISFRSKLSYAEAEPQYPTFVTGREIINFYKDIFSAPLQDIDELTMLFDMNSYLDQKVSGYSSGMLKKLSLICCFVGDVELYILDEPLITIDLESANKLYELISDRVKRGKTFLLSSHQEIDQCKLRLDGVFEIQNKQIKTC